MFPYCFHVFVSQPIISVGCFCVFFFCSKYSSNLIKVYFMFQQTPFFLHLHLIKSLIKYHLVSGERHLFHKNVLCFLFASSKHQINQLILFISLYFFFIWCFYIYTYLFKIILLCVCVFFFSFIIHVYVTVSHLTVHVNVCAFTVYFNLFTKHKW